MAVGTDKLGVRERTVCFSICSVISFNGLGLLLFACNFSFFLQLSMLLQSIAYKIIYKVIWWYKI
jgi:hypothetical protein